MTFSAVIFDMDGVLVDSEPLHLRTTNEVLARRGAHLDDATYATFIGMTELAFFGQLVELLGLSEAPADLARKGTSAAAAGFVNFMGYVGAGLAGDVVTGILYKKYGWEVAIYAWAACAFMAAIAAGLLWNRRPEHA